ncbi:MAG: acetylxylan esterase [Verrucomicrobiales bacterium]|nr:acetylxylan esterase [Verrucomicrobiales bacterium]
MKKNSLAPRLAAIALYIFQLALLQAASAALFKTTGDKMFAAYFKDQTDRISAKSLSEIKTIEDWNVRKKTYSRQMHEMLGLDPMPPRTPLKATVTGKLQHAEFEVWKVHFQSKPGLYVTGNLYVPKGIEKPAPTILYVCGHGRVKKDGVSFGNKVHYQHHGIWFARNGYVCLVIDTLQLGEIEGIHHGTYNHDMWWWNSRGYSSASVEAWNCIRALDYLETLKFVDKNRFGVTGRSGGGAYSWWISVLDERIKVSAPVAGIADLKSHVYAGFPNSGRLAHGVVEGHCDCMFHVNTYRWDFGQVAALVAPRPLMILNTDDDRIFPLDGVTRVFNGARKIYDLHGARDKLGLVIVPGGHSDTQPLRVPAFNWFNRHLKGAEPPITITAEKLFEPEQLKVFDKLPADEINTKIQESFTQLASAKQKVGKATIALLRKKTFGGWPGNDVPFNEKRISKIEKNGAVLETVDFDSQEKIRLGIYLSYRSGLKNPKRIELKVFGGGNDLQQGPAENSNVLYVAFLPRGLGRTALSDDKSHRTQTRRRFMLLGQTLAGMQVWDVRRCVQVLHELGYDCPITLIGDGESASLVSLAALYEKVETVSVKNYPKDDKVQPDYLNISRIVTPAQLLDLVRQRSRLNHRK